MSRRSATTRPDHLGLELLFRQASHEGQLITWIHDADRRVKQGICIGAVFNPAALAHTSIALRAAIESTDLPLIELHIANLYNRQQFRRHSYLSSVSRGAIVGFGYYGYRPAISGLYQASLR